MKYLKIFTDFIEVVDPLGDAAAGRLFRAMLRYAKDGTAPDLKGKEAVAWTVARQHIDRETEAYDIKVKNLKRGNVSVSGIKVPVSGEDKDKEKDKNKDKDKDISFLSAAAGAEKKETHPSLEEIKQYAQEAFLSVDAEHFYNYYEANGWHMGQHPMQDWKAALKAWARNAPIAPRPVAKQPEMTDKEIFQQAIELHRMKEAKQI